jgi:hypothetical protein
MGPGSYPVREMAMLTAFFHDHNDSTIIRISSYIPVLSSGMLCQVVC